MSEMLDEPYGGGLYKTTRFYSKLDDYFRSILVKETALAYDQGYAAASVRKEREMIAKGTECHI